MTYWLKFNESLRISLVVLLIAIVLDILAIPIKENIGDFPLSVYEAARLLYRYGYGDTQEGNIDGNPLTDERSIFPMNYHPSGMQSTPLAYKIGLKKFQRRFGLKPTGNLDPDTARILAAPRCGNPDFIQEDKFQNHQRFRRNALIRKKRYKIGDPKMYWSHKRITWQIRNYPTRHLTRGRTHAVFQHSFNMWSRAADLEFVEEKDYSKSADIIIQFGSRRHGDTMAFDGEGGILAHAFYPNPEPVYSFSGDCHFDDDEYWNDGPHKDYTNLLSVAVHELGHSMGLGHSFVPNSIMYPYYLKRWTKVELHNDDITGAQEIYGPPKPGKFIPPEPDLPDIPPPPTLTTPDPDKNKLIDYCNVSIDAIAEIRGLVLYIFKGAMQWRVTWSVTVSTWVSYQFRDGPAKITYYWPALPNHVDYIDAVIERNDDSIYIFRADKFWLLADNKNMVPNFPVDGILLSNIGLPKWVDKIDTLFRWAENGNIYIFVGEYYWLFDENVNEYGQVIPEPNYPRYIKETWQNLPLPVTAAFTGLNGVTLFFNGNQYFAFDNIAMKVMPNFPKPARLGIIGCTDV